MIGAIASTFNSESGAGKEFISAIHSIGSIFMPLAGITALIPVLSKIIKCSVAPIVGALGAEPSIAATTFIAVEKGEY